MVYEKTVERSTLWAKMTVDELKAEYKALGHTPALTSDDHDQCLRWLYLSQMRRMVGD